MPAEEHGTATVGRPIEHGDVPKGLVAVEHFHVQPPGGRRQLSQASRRPNPFTTYVPVQFEVSVVGPAAGAEPAGEFVKALPETGHPVYSTRQQLNDDVPGYRATVDVMTSQEHQGPHILGQAGFFKVEKGAVLGAQPVRVAGQSSMHSCSFHRWLDKDWWIRRMLTFMR